MEPKFIDFLQQLKHEDNSELIESLEGTYLFMFEANASVEQVLMKIANDFDLPASNWDDYVKKEIIHSKRYENLINNSPSKIRKDSDKLNLVLNALSIDFSSPETIEIDINDFTQENGLFASESVPHQANIINHIMAADKDHVDDPDNVNRHAKQKELLEKSGGINEEPVILLKRGDKYELIEGYHRMVQLLLANNYGKDKFKLNAYVGEQVPISSDKRKELEKSSLISFIKNIFSGN
jgi:hypothetical protein